MVFGLESMGGNGVLKMSALRFLNIVVSYRPKTWHVSERQQDTTFQVQIFDIFPQKFLAPLRIFHYHYGQWDPKLQMAIKPQGIDESG